MQRISNQLYLFLLVALGMIGCIVLIAMGHNSEITYTFLGLNALGAGLGVQRTIKGGKDNGR